MLSNSFCFWFKRKEKRKELLVTPVFILGVFLMYGPARSFILEDYIYVGAELEKVARVSKSLQDYLTSLYLDRDFM